MDIELNLSYLTINRTFYWENIKIKLDRNVSSDNSNIDNARTENTYKKLNHIKLNLSEAYIHKYKDEEKSWPEKNKLLIKNFNYDDIEFSIKENSENNNKIKIENKIVNKRVEWIKLQEDGKNFNLDSFNVFASLYKKRGDAKVYKKILIEKEKNKILQKKISPIYWILHKILEFTVNFGYSPAKILFSFAIFYALAVICFQLLFWLGYIQPGNHFNTYLTVEYIPEELDTNKYIIYFTSSNIKNFDLFQDKINWKKLILHYDLIKFYNYKSKRYILNFDPTDNKQENLKKVMELKKLLWQENIYPDSYPKFISCYYALDIILPFININQDNYWTAYHNRIGTFFVILFKIIGWLLSSILVLSVTGIIKK